MKMRSFHVSGVIQCDTSVATMTFGLLIHIDETLAPEQCYEDARTRICRLYDCKPESMVITSFNFIPPAADKPEVKP
jgi:hypothetical protein